MPKKIRVGILFGGRSPEHEVALQSAKSIIEAIDKDKYEVSLIGIDKHGKWYFNEASNYLLHEHDPKHIALNSSENPVTLVPWESKASVINLSHDTNQRSVDVIFPVLHGAFGEDGTMQGLLKLSGVPFVGASVLGSAIGMDKDVMKRLLKETGLPIAKFCVLKKPDEISFDAVVEKIGLPFFVKPANAGSSVGVSKVKNEADFAKAIEEAFSYDNKILLEEFIECREIECAILGNENPKASLPGEIIPHHEFYSYEAKYIDENGAGLEIPANLSKEKVEEVQNLAIKAFQTLCCEGMARVDFFMDKRSGKLFVNEINTIPGFTKISMYPKLWEASGLSYTKLIDKLITLALERHKRDSNIKTTFS